MPLSQTQIGTVRRLIEAAPDAAIRTLENALASGRNDNSIAEVHDLVSQEMVERRVRSSAFAPIVAVCSTPSVVGLNLPANALTGLWRALRAETPETVDEAVQAVMSGRVVEDGPPIFDRLCGIAREKLKAREPGAFAALAERLDAHAPGGTDNLVRVLVLAPFVRSALPRLSAWVRNLGDEQGPAMRLAFRDATRDAENGTPLFMEILATHLEERWHVLRLISVMMDRPSDRYLASSELAGFGEAVLAQIDGCVARVARFDPDLGAEAGASAAASIASAVSMIGEFDQWLALTKEGPWGSRIAEQRKALAAAVEGRLREAEAAVAAALPAQKPGYGGRAARLVPKVSADPDPKAIRRAQAYLALVDGARMSAGNGGFGSLRLKVVEALEQRLDPYIEDVLEMLRHNDGDLDRLRAFLDVAAQAMSAVRNPEAGDIVRRRAAAA